MFVPCQSSLFTLVEADAAFGRRKPRSAIGESDIMMTMRVSPQPQLTSTSTGKASIPLTAADKTRASMGGLWKKQDARAMRFLRVRQMGFTETAVWGIYWAGMKTLEQVESDVRLLPPEKQEELRDWLENMLEDQLEFTDEFKAKIERGEQDLREGSSRIRRP